MRNPSFILVQIKALQGLAGDSNLKALLVFGPIVGKDRMGSRLPTGLAPVGLKSQPKCNGAPAISYL
jgi:hypothetical protein